MLCSLTMKALWPDKREDSEGAVPGEPNWPTIKINIGSNNGGGPLQYAAPILINFHLGPPLRTPVIVTHARAVVLIWIAATFPPIQTRRPKRRSASHYELSKSVIPPASLVHLVLGARGGSIHILSHLTERWGCSNSTSNWLFISGGFGALKRWASRLSELFKVSCYKP